jgi:hypothetical protein
VGKLNEELELEVVVELVEELVEVAAFGQYCSSGTFCEF